MRISIKLRGLFWLSLALWFLAFEVNAFASTFVGLTSASTFNVGDRARSVAVGDFNGDGLPDIAVAGFASSEINVFLSCASGTPGCVNGFLPNVSYAVGPPVSIVTADVNGDGNLDLIVVSEGSNSVALLLGAGNGTFTNSKCNAAGFTCGTGVGPISIAVGNFKGQAKEVDVVIANSTSNTVTVMFGNGVNFNAPKTFSVGNAPTSVAVGDLNGDGFQDIAVTNGSDGTVSILLGNAKGSFTAQSPVAVGPDPVSVTIADFNGDKISDLAVANSTVSYISILLGVGNGTFQPASSVYAGRYPQSVAAADFNGDGRNDLAVADGAGNNVTILLGNGDGTFQTGVPYASGARTVFALVADINGDKKPDLVVANADLLPGQVSILLGNGDGTFQSGVNFTTGVNPQGIVSGDFNCDGKPDLATANAGDNTVNVWLGNGNGTFSSPQTLSADSHPVSIVTADFNGDGIADIAVVNSLSGDVSIFLGNSTCTGFAPAVNYSLGIGVNPLSLAVADFNGDKYPDLVVANAGNSTNPGNVIVLLNNTDGTFGSPIITNAGINPNFVAAADFNGDKKQDVVISNEIGGNVTVLLGNGDGTFTVKSSDCVGSTLCKGVPTSVAIADFNGDGKLDLAVTNYADSSISVLLGNGDGTFRTAKSQPVGAVPLYIVAAPLQGNSSQQDLIVANSEGDTVCVLANGLNKSASFKSCSTHTYVAGESPAGLAVADFNGDGKLDVAVANQASNNITVLTEE